MSDTELANQTEQALTQRHFRGLDGRAAEFRKPGQTLTSGTWKLYYFYAGLVACAGAPAYSYESTVQCPQKRRLLEQWLEEQPESVSARVALAQLWVARGFRERGADYAQNVTPEQWRALAADLSTARDYLTTATFHSDPHAYLVAMLAAEGLQDVRTEIDRVFRSATRAYPTYVHFYSLRATQLEAKWYGQPGELRRYAASVLSEPGGDLGLLAYSYIAYRLLLEGQDEYRAADLSWNVVKIAYAGREKSFGLRPKDWNALLCIAVRERDASFARAALAKIDDHWEPDVWGDHESFDDAVAWVKAASQRLQDSQNRAEHQNGLR